MSEGFESPDGAPPEPPVEGSLLDGDSVVAWLEAHPEFFAREPELLVRLEIPHPDGEGVVSLVQRQMQALRQRRAELEANIAELVQVARDNERVNRRLHALALELMAAGTVDDVVCATLVAMRDQFDTGLVVLKLIDQGDGRLRARDRAGVWQRSDAAIEHFVEFFRERRVHSGRLGAAQLEALFGERAGEVGSVALLPLKATQNIGLLALGHPDERRFHPGKGLLFLTQLGELLSQRLAAVLAAQQAVDAAAREAAGRGAAQSAAQPAAVADVDPGTPGTGPAPEPEPVAALADGEQRGDSDPGASPDSGEQPDPGGQS